MERFWRVVGAHLASSGWRVIAIDLSPFGYSDRDPTARYDRAHQAERLRAVLVATAQSPAVVVGHANLQAINARQALYDERNAPERSS